MTQPIPKMSRDIFLENLRKSKLLDGKDFDGIISGLSDVDRGRTLARELVDLGHLTRFQAELLLAGRTHGFFLGQYRILEEIGRGGMGRVFKAEHSTMGRQVALKILSPGLMKTDKARILFQREVKAAAKLNHPNIVTAFDANQLDDRFYLVMEYVDGPNLSEFVKKRGPLPVSQACDFIRQTALGLQYAHDLGMVHRDIKPANLLVQRNNSKAMQGAYTVKILDFGLARLSTQEDGDSGGKETILTHKQSVMGTPDYLAPEQARNIHAVDSRSDIYSLGCAFHYLVTGKVPFPGGNAFEKLVRHTTEIPVPAKLVNPEVSDVVSEIIERMLAKDPKDRFQSGSELAQVLEILEAHEQGSWVDVSPVESPEKERDLSPGSSSSLPETAAVTTHEDVSELWASLEDNSNSNTLVTGGSGTTVSATDTAKSDGKSKGSRNEFLLMSGIIVCVVLLVIAIIRTLIHRFGNG